MRSRLNYQKSKQVAERNSTSEREALSEKPEEDAMKPPAYQDIRESNFLFELRKYLLLKAKLAASITYSAGMSPPGGFWSDNVGELAEGRVRRVTTAFIVSISCIMGAYCAARSCCTLAISALFAGDGGKKFPKLFDTAEWEDLWEPVLAGPKEETAVAYQLREKSRRYLLLLAILGATITYQAGVKPSGGLSQAYTTDGHHYPGAPVLHTTYDRRYLVFFFYFDASAFIASLVFLFLLLSNISWTRGIKNRALQVAKIMDLLGLMIGAFAPGTCRRNWGIGWNQRGFYAGDSARKENEGNQGVDPRFSKSELAVDRDDPNRSVERNNQREATWRVASSVPHHMTGNRNLLLARVHNRSDGEGIVVHPSANGEVPLRVRGSGSVRTESIALDDVWYVPGLDSNLVSTGQLARQGCAVSLGPAGCRITMGDALVGTARFTEAGQFELESLKVAASASSM